jgi:hypothetical protein
MAAQPRRRAALITTPKLVNAAAELGAVAVALGLGVVGAPAWAVGAVIAAAMLWWAWSRKGRLSALAEQSAARLASAGAVGFALIAGLNSLAFLAGRVLAASFQGSS